MGLLSFVWSLTKLFIICLLITFLPGIPPNAEFKEYSVVKPKSLDAEFLVRKHLDNAERIFEGQFTGPEAFAMYNGEVYTGIHGGFVVKIEGGEIKPVVKFGENCDDIIEEHKCGRPLGMKFDAAGNLYVADAYYGIFKYNVQTGQKTLLVGVNEEIEGKKSTFVNDVAVAKDGSVYFTVTSTTFPLFNGVHAMLAPGDGRVVKYDPQTKKAAVLADGLHTPNGIALSLNEDFLVFAESVGARVMRFDLKGNKKGILSVFAEGLPGLPDNIRIDGQGGFYVSLVVPADESHPALPIVLAPFPNIRKFLSRVIFLLELPFAQINKYYPNYFCRRAEHFIGHFSSTSGLSDNGVNILNLDSNGQIRDALIGRDGSIAHISDMIVSGDYILLGSPYNNYIGRIPRPNTPHQLHIKSVRYEEATPQDIKQEELAAKKAAAEAKAKKAREDQAQKAAEEAERARKAAEEAARLKKEAENAARKAAEESKARLAAEEAKKKAADEARARKVAEEAAKKAAEEAKARKAAEESARRATEEAKAKKLAEEAKAKKLAEDAKARKIAEETKARKAAEELKLKKAAEDSARRKAAEDAKPNRASGNSGKN
ncbi:Adipocyte plasma membrane-associated protein [Frankliniella fusca]|uniref:Adipocyte plasma membrane-associated protein n=1 Tax=Frankliniella fusca TaxID=407009 RepID=A0AAE1I518_9NEOP|nr:Adipocyte plasma membrane-associated protein [Frankliniella fusca]